MTLAMVAEDRAVVTEGQLKDAEVEFVRGADGRVTWVRAGGRLHTRRA
jgi:hypothetical protein